MDGGPHQLVAPGQTWSPTWTIDQPAATLWYHPHLHGETAEHVYRGLAGLFLVDDDRAFDLVATDGGLLAAPEPMSHVALSPGERAEVVVEVTRGEEVVVVSRPTQVAGDPCQQRYSGGDDAFDVLQLRAASTLRPSPGVPDRLVALDDLSAEEVAVTREFRLSTPRINGLEMDMTRIDEVVEAGTTERWLVSNGDAPRTASTCTTSSSRWCPTTAARRPRTCGRARTRCSSPAPTRSSCCRGSRTTPTRTCRTCSTATSCSTRTTG